MAEAKRNRCAGFIFAALSFIVGATSVAQSIPVSSRPVHAVHVQAPLSGSLSGRLTNLHSAPLAGISVVLHNQATGEELHATTAKNGEFHFASLEVGEYTLDADEPRLGHSRLEGILVSGGVESRIQAAVQFEKIPPAPLFASLPIPIAVQPALAPAGPRLPAPAAASTTSSVTTLTPQSPAHPAAQAPLALAPTSISPQVVSTPAPALLASAATENTRLLRLHAPPTPSPQPSVAESSRNSTTPAQSLSPASTPSMNTTPTFLQQRATLETESGAIESSIALALPRPIALSSHIDASSVLLAAAVASIQAALLQSPQHLGPIVTAAEKPDPASPPVTATIAAEQMQSLPVAGRRWREFLLDTPAATASSNGEQPSFRGASEASAEITVDGASVRLAFGVSAGSNAGSRASDPTSQDAAEQSSMSQAMSESWTGGRGFGVSESAIREVTATAGNAEVESMRSPGGQTSILTQGGSDALHGQGFFFDRQNNWGALNPFTQWVTQTSQFAPLAPFNSALFPVFDNYQYSSGQSGPPQSFTPPDHEIVWGLGMGSQILRDKLFWFAALDSYHRNDSGLAMVKHPYLQPPCETSPCPPTGFFAAPSDAQLQLLSAQLDLPSSDPVVEGLTAYSQMLETLAGLLGPAPRTAAQWLGFGRIDWQIAERHRLTVEATGADWNAPGGGLTQVSENYGNHSFGSSRASEEWLLARWEAYLTPNLLAVTQGSAGHTILTARPDTPSEFEKTFLTVNSYGQLPQIVVDSGYGFTIGNPSRFGQGSYPDEKLYHAQEMLDWVHGKLLAKAGFELDHNADATSLLRNQTGTYTYSKVQDFISDALIFQTLGLQDPNNYLVQHNCGATDTTLGSQPCYSYYSQMIGPTNWHLSTNDWSGFVTTQWQASKFAVFSAGLRWELEQMPPPLAALANSELPLTEKLPSLGSNWGPRVSLAIGNVRNHWPVLRLGYGMYYGRTENATIETALTQTGSLNGDLSFFMRPSDDCQDCSGGAPPFPYVLTGQPSSVVKPSVVEFAPNFKTPEVHQAVAAIEEGLPGRLQLTASAMLSLGRRLPVFIDTNFDPAVNPGTITTVNPGITYTVCDETPPTPTGSSNTNGACGNLGLGPIKAATITVPFYASWPFADCAGNPNANRVTGQCGWLNPNYQQINQITSKANSTYEAAMVKVTRYGRRGLSLHAHYTYAHAMDWNPNESPLDPNPANFNLEYGTSNLDVRHSAAVMAIFDTPWKLRDLAGHIANGWMLSGIGQFRSGLPYSMRITGSLPEEFDDAGNAIVGLGPSMTGSGGDNRYFGLPRNTFRYPNTWKADVRLGKKFNLGEMRELEVLAESFNLFNHQNVTEIETTGYTIDSGSPPSTLGAPGNPPTLNFLTGLKISSTTGLPIPGFGQPLNIDGADFYRERQIQLGLRMRF
jgi:Carboxypeptidase regulatory-like domain